MASPKFRFFLDGVLQLWNFGDLLRRDADYDVIDAAGTVFVPKVPIATTNLNLAQKIWFKSVDDNEVIEVYYGTRLMFKFDNLAGNLIFGFNDINILPLTKGGTGYEAVGADEAAQLVDLLENHFGLKGAAYKDAGTSAGEVLLLADDNKLPALDGSALTGITNTPPGAIIWYPSATPPNGYLKANGAQVSRSVYADLFSVIGTSFGPGNGTTTFTLPDLRGEFIRGWDDGRGIDTGRAFGSFQADEFKSHEHPYDMRGTAQGGNGSAIEGSNGTYYGKGYALDPVGGVETRPRNIALLACIKY